MNLHLFTPTTYNVVGAPVTFNVFLSAVNRAIEVDEYFYANAQEPEVNPIRFSSRYFPLSAETAVLESTYLSGGSIPITLSMSAVGDVLYNNEAYKVFTDPNATYIPAPSAYLNPTTGAGVFFSFNQSYANPYLDGVNYLYLKKGYIVPDYFTNKFYANRVWADFGDGIIREYPYGTGVADTIVHTFTASDVVWTTRTINVSITAETLTETFTRTFLSAIEITNKLEEVGTETIRANADSAIFLPHQKPFIPANEWVAHEAINSVFRQHYDNFQYLQDVSAIYQLAPLQNVGWASVDSAHKLNWHTNTIDTQEVSSSNTFKEITDIQTLANDSYDFLYLGLTDKVNAYSYSLNSRDVLYDTAPNNNLQTATRITGFAVDSTNRLYVLDSRKLIVRVYRYSSVDDDYVPVFEWGGLGGVTGKTKFYKPNDIFIANNRVFVVDSGNNCVKRFSLGGQWEETYLTPDSPISATLDDDLNLYVVTATTLSKYNWEATEEYTKPIQMLTSTPVRIRHSKGFNYILTQDNVIRTFASGETTNLFALRSSRVSPYTRIHLDINGNCYITDGRVVLKYVDSPILLDATPLQPEVYWSWDELAIQPNQFVCALTYNTFLHRMYDNLRTFFHTIERKVIKNSNGTLGIVDLENCDVGIFGGFPIQKDEIYIGMNEFVTPEVMNRCLLQLLFLEQYLLDVLLNKYSGCNTGDASSFKIPLPDLPDCCWSWEARGTDLCCVTWEQLERAGTTWNDAASGCCVITTL